MLGLFLGITLRFCALGLLLGAGGGLFLTWHHQQKSAIGIWGFTAVWFLFYAAFVYFTLPTPSLASTISANLLNGLVIAIVLALFGGQLQFKQLLSSNSKHSKTKVVNAKVAPFAQLAAMLLIAWLVASGIFAFLGIKDAKSVATSAPITQVATTKNAPLPAVATAKQAPVVNTPQTVLTQVNNSLSNIKNANVYDVQHVRAQINHGQLVYVAPLAFDGSFFRYLRYRQVDGYFVTNATSKTARPQFVKRAMAYTPEAYFAKDVRRKMYAATANSGYVLMANAPQLEISENGTPYYVATLIKRFGATNRQDFRHKAVVTVNAVSGALKYYRDLSKKPSWLDVAIDPTSASEQVAAWGSDRNGWWNANGWGGARNGVMVSVAGAGTEGDDNSVTPVMYNGQIFYQQSLTSAKSAQTSVMGYAFTDAATGKTTYYRETEDAMTPDRAQKLARDMMKQTGWKPKMPMLYRIDHRPTWVVSMLDSSNAFRSYVYLQASGNGTSSTVATGESATAALAKYRALFGENPTAAATTGKKQAVRGTVVRTSLSNSTLYFLLKGDTRVYAVALKDDATARFIQANDQLQFTARVTKTTGSVIGKITNSTLK
ncbi:hypothetical protein [Lacticaseibacillus sp. N501-2]|uniref:hypothetical protein n=1 Tax=Lacticaseibacillus salsurae TaxID=3367729 RepID=UPI0038B376FA